MDKINFAHRDASIKNITVLQVHTFYGAYIDLFYCLHKEYKKLSFSKQISKLIQDAHGAVHMFAPYLQGCKTQLVIANCAYSQLAWAREHGSIVEGWNECAQNNILLSQINTIKPDVLYFGNTILHQADFIRSLTHKPRLVMGWRAADVPLNTNWTGYDSIFSGLGPMLSLATSLGAKEGVWFAPGMPSWIAKTVEDIPQDIDVVFSGSISPTQHINRLALLDTVACAAHKYGFSLALYISCEQACITENMRPFVRPPVFGLDMHRALRRGKIVIDDRASHGIVLPNGRKKGDLGGVDTSNMRLFEGTGGGSLVITEKLEGLHKLFQPDVEVVTYASYEEACEQIVYYLGHDAERKVIAEAGKKRCLGQWNMANRATAFMDEIYKKI